MTKENKQETITVLDADSVRPAASDRFSKFRLKNEVRTEVRESSIRYDNPDACISCNICLTACPVAKATRQYRGPKLNGPALTRLRMLVTDHDPMVKFCSNCKSCDRVCPSGTHIAAMNMKARAEYFKDMKHDTADLILSSNEELGRLITYVPFMGTAANIGAKVASASGILSKFGVGDSAPLPKYANFPFIRMFKKIRQPSCSRKVLFFPGCYVNYNEPELGVLLVKILNRNNVEVIVDPRLKCCGSPILSTGYLDKVEKNALHNTAILKEYTDRGIDIITTCTTCSLFLTQEYEELFNIPAVNSYAPHVYEAMEYLCMLHDRGEMNTNLGAVRKKLAYHTSCHIQVQGMGRPTLKIMKLIPGVETEDLKAGCCGLSGVYGYKKETAPIGRIIGSNLRNKLTDSEADVGICECNICRIQMRNGTGKDAIHPLQILASAYRRL